MTRPGDLDRATGDPRTCPRRGKSPGAIFGCYVRNIMANCSEERLREFGWPVPKKKVDKMHKRGVLLK